MFIYIPSILSTVHYYTGTLMIIIAVYSFYQASTLDPGIIKDENQSKWLTRKYPYDDVMYKKDTKCKTCKITKPARSKHCTVCDHCVELFDHHCIWLNNCVGANNFKWFLTFIFMQFLLVLYGAVVGVIIIYRTYY